MKKRSLALFFTFYSLLFSFSSCNKVGVYEKTINIPKFEWHYSFVPSFQFNISDTAAEYNMYMILRHTDAYSYSNIRLNVGQQNPGDTMFYQRLNIVLGSDATGWEGTGMDDIWEIRKPITNGPVRFHKAGTYAITVAQIMREDPLKNIMNIGIRVEKQNSR